ncbi:MAG: alpha/beta fold hydrolase [Dehalococcoidales bacterium]|nr:alpha/beta fold hydrolase [Dehalococcoidales bacterium]
MKRWLIAAMAVILALIVLFTGASAYLGYSLTRVKRVPVEDSPSRLGLAYEDITFPSQDRELLLQGWYLPSGGSNKIIIMVHGEQYHRADPEIEMLKIACRLVESGYSVLTFDLRGHGDSEGSMISGGYLETQDLHGAVEFAGTLGFERIGVLGFSMGAVTALLEAGENVKIDAVVADSSFADLQDMMESEFSQRTHAPSFFLYPLLFMIKTIYGVDFQAISPIESVAGIAPRPVLFIHGENDETIPPDHALRLQQASGNPRSEVWIAPGSAHVRACADHPEEYLERISTFFDSGL